MLLEFRVRNFRSIREEAVFSMAAAPQDSTQEHHLTLTGLEKIRRVVNSAAIFGANASGKTSLIKAFAHMRGMVLNSHQLNPDSGNGLTPFKLREEHQKFTTSFEITFIIDGIRHQYGFEANSEIILSEYLLVYEKSKPQVWFNRILEDSSGSYKYSYSDYFLGPKKVWESTTRKEVLYLTNAIQLNNEQLKPLYQAIADMVIYEQGPKVGFEVSASLLDKRAMKERITYFLKNADVGISNIKTEGRSGKSISVNIESGTIESKDTDFMIPLFSHLVGGKSYEFDYSDESSGTQTLFSLMGPIFDILDKGKLLIIDELDNSLHPLMIRSVIGFFHSKEYNKNGAQLIFTTHDATLLDSKTLRRDQVWLMEKDYNHASQIFPLSDFSPRKGEAIEKNYLGGRYGGIPIIESQEV